MNCILKTIGNNFELEFLTARIVCIGLEQKTDIEEEVGKVLVEEKLFQIFKVLSHLEYFQIKYYC